jgi:DNA-directed RNA polymerase subunit F
MQYVELCEIKGEVLEYFCVFEVQAERGWVVNRMLPGFVREVVDGVVRSLQAIQEEMVVEIVQVMPKVSEEERRKVSKRVK